MPRGASWTIFEGIADESPHSHGRARPGHFFSGEGKVCIAWACSAFVCRMSGRRTGFHFAWACSAVLAAEIRASSVVFSFSSLKRGSRAPYGAPGMPALAKDRRPACEPASPYGAPLRRLKSLVPHFLPDRLIAGAGRLRDIHPGPHNGPGGCHPRTPGTTIAKPWAQAPLPIHAKYACRAPLCGWG